MSLARPEPRTRVLVVGKSGRGKSTRVKELLRGWQKTGHRVVAVDPQDEYSRHGRADGLVVTGPLRDRCTAAELARNPGLMLDKRLSLAVVPSGPTFRDWARAFLLVSRLARHAGRLVLVADEVGAWCDSSIHPDCHKAAAELAALSATGRHKAIALVMVSQRAALVPATARAQVTDLIAFQQDEANDVDALAARMKDQARAEKVLHLPAYQSIEWSDDEPTPTQSTPPALKAV